MSPNLEIQVNKTNAGLYTVMYSLKEAPLNEQETAFAANGIEIVSPAQIGFLKAKGGKGTFEPYSRTGADVFYDDRTDKIVVVPNGAISKLVDTANLVDAHRQGKEYVIPKGDQRDLVYDRVDEMLKSGIAFVAPWTDRSTNFRIWKKRFNIKAVFRQEIRNQSAEVW